MIEATDSYGKTHYLVPSAIAEVEEAATSSQWHGIRAYIRTFDGRLIEARESAKSIAAMVVGSN